MFYKLLLDGDKRHNWVMRSGTMDFVEKHKENNTERIFYLKLFPQLKIYLFMFLYKNF